MRLAPWITCLWPGLSRLWLRAEWASLLAATAFALLLDGVLGVTCLWPELLVPTWKCLAWGVVLVFWCLGAFEGARFVSRVVRPGQPGNDDLFIQAQGEYLKGHWFEAESLLARIVGDDPRDVDARLLLATLYRRTRRVQEARKQLQLLERIENAEKWEREIANERRLVDRREREVAARAGQEGTAERDLQEAA